MLLSKLTNIIKEEVIKFLKEMNSLDRAINRLKRGGGQDREEDAIARRIRANNNDEMAKTRPSKKKPAEYSGFRTWGNWKFYRFILPDGTEVEHDNIALRNKYPGLLKLVPEEDLKGADRGHFVEERAAVAILDKIGPKGPTGV